MKLEIYGVLRDIYFLALSFKSVQFVFIPRSANDKAVSIAKQAMWVMNPI